MHQTRLRLSIGNCTLQRSHREAVTHHRSIYSPPYNFAGWIWLLRSHEQYQRFRTGS